MSLTRLLLPGALAVAAAGCLNSATLITVKTDGSGTIEQTMLMNTAAAKMMLGGVESPEASAGPQVDEADLRRAAERMGGVRFVSAEPMTTGTFEGVKALYAFDDINAVQISQSPDLGSGTADAPVSAPASSPLLFHLAQGAGSSVLTVRFDEGAQAPDAGDDPAAIDPGDLADPQVLGMMKVLLQGFKVAIDLQVDGAIVQTNADYVNGSRVTLLELDLGALLEDEARLADLQARLGPGTTLAEARPFLEDLNGIRINQPVVTIEYR